MQITDERILYPFLEGGGTMGKLIRDKDWSQSEMGNPDQWPLSLQIAISIMLQSQFPMFIWWGSSYTTLYNDAYRFIMGEKHPHALGASGPKVWPEIWDVVGPMADSVLYDGKACWWEDQQLMINRHGYTEETYFTYSYSPVRNDKGIIEGVFCACTETTEKVMANKRFRKSEENLYNIIQQAPVAMCIFRGPEFIVDIANERMFNIWGKTSEEVLHQPIFSGLPEVKDQGFEDLLKGVYTTGKTYSAHAVPVVLPRQDSQTILYLNFVYEALRDKNGKINGVMAVATDVTEQVLNQKKIEESEQEARSFIESAPFPIGVYTGPDLVIKMANEAIINIYGKGKDVIGKKYGALLPELARQAVLQQLQEVYETGIPYHATNQRLEIEVNQKLQTFYFNYSFTPLFDRNGKIYGVMNTGVDVTNLNYALKQIEEAQDKAQLAIESAGLGTYEVNMKTNEIFTSARFQEIWGIYNTTDRNQYASHIYPEDLELRNRAHEASLKTGLLGYELRVMTTTNEIKWVRIRGKILFDEAHQPDKLIGVVQDITEQKVFAAELERQVYERTQQLEQAKENLQSSYNYLQEIINKFESALVSLEPVFEDEKIVDFKFRMTNQAFKAYSNIAPEEIKGMRISEIFPEYFNTDTFEKYCHTYVTGKTNEWELHYNADGLDLFLTIVCSKMNDEVVVNFIDFTKLKSLQVDLLRNIEELKLSNRNLEEFAYAASHDLKEPVRKIHFYSDRLKNEIGAQLSEHHLQMFQKLENASDRMYSLIEDLLSYSQVNLRPKQQEKIELDHILQVVKDDLELDILKDHALLEIGSLPVVNGYSRQLQQLFQNLLSNSLKYIHTNVRPHIIIESRTVKGIDTHIKMSARDMSKLFYEITVTDNGIGFDQEDSEKIFQVFERLPNHHHIRGTGIGLSIVQKVMENHEGYIAAYGKKGEGARFHLYFPVIH